MFGNLFGSATPFDGALAELGELVYSPEFKAAQLQYFDRFCDEFSDAEENKLSYTTIHNEYQKTVEATIESNLGAEKYQLLCDGLEEHAQAGKGMLSTGNQKTDDAFEVLHCAADFEKFKMVMLAKRNARVAGKQKLAETTTVVDIQDALHGTAELVNAAQESDGWVTLVDEDGMLACAKDNPSGGMYLRYSIALPLPYEQAVDCYLNFLPESVNFRDRVKRIDILKELGPDDYIVAMTPDLPAMVSWAMGLPEQMFVQLKKVTDMPSPGETSYVCVPYDPEAGVCVEKSGPMMVKSGVLRPHPTDPNQSQFHAMDLMELPSMMPNAALGMMLRKMVPSQLTGQAEKYKTFRGLR
jgi:hypothetical protein